MLCFCFVFLLDGDPRELHVLTHSFPTRRSSDRAAAVRDQELAERQLKAMHARFKPDQLGERARVSYRLFEYEVERGRESLRFRKLRRSEEHTSELQSLMRIS